MDNRHNQKYNVVAKTTNINQSPPIEDITEFKDIQNQVSNMTNKLEGYV